MNVVYATDENYAFLTGISMISLFENNQDEPICVYIIVDGITKENVRQLKKIGDQYRQEVLIIEQPDLEDMAGIKIEISNWSLSAFVRIFLPDLLPLDVDKVIWLDCDTIVMDSLLNLWKTNMDTGGGGIAPVQCLIALRILKENMDLLRKTNTLIQEFC